MSERVIINQKDNVGITLAGEGDIPAGHKIALRDIPQGQYVIKYGEIIGRAKVDIKAGEWVHTHNVASHLNEDVEYSYNFHAEVPEMFGAEQLLMNKCESKETFEEYKQMIEDFKDFYTKQGFPVYENLSPGNKKGGITTLEEKSLGCVEKAGTSKIVDVLSYGEQVTKAGVSALNAPGNDLIAATALAASGCQIVLFTTGRGTPFSTFVPTMKIGTNDRISAYKNNWIDFNAYSMDDEGLFNLVKATASGDYKCKSEDVREIAFFKTGVTL